METGDYGDLIALARDIVALLRDHECEQALQRVRTARRDLAARRFDERAEVINRINSVVHRLRAEREKVRATVTFLPEQERLFAEFQIEPLLDEVFNREIAGLLAVKRRHSTP
jgi:hypothetical protein